MPSAVEVVRGDLTAPQTLDHALEDVDAVFLVWTAPRTAVDAALARILARTPRIVFLSAPVKTAHPFFQQPNPMREMVLQIEDVIQRSDAEWTFVRPGMFAANALNFWAPQIQAGDTVRWPVLDAPTAPIDERDIAAVSVRALTNDGHHRGDYVITGPQSLTQREQIATIGQVLGRSLRIEEMSRDEWSAMMPPPAAKMLLDAWTAALGQPAFLTSTFEQVTGTPARSFAEWVRHNRSAFAPD